MTPENRRILVATVLSVVIITVWQVAFAPKPSQKPRPTTTETTQGPEAPAPSPPAPGPAPTPATPGPSSPAVNLPAPEAPEELHTLRGPGFEAVLSSHGGALAHLVLQGRKFQREKREGGREPIDLVRLAPGQPSPLAIVASPEWGGAQDGPADPAARAAMRVVAKDEHSVTYEGRVGQAAIRKTVRVTGKPFELGVEVEVDGPAAKDAAVLVLYPGYFPPDAGSRGFLAGPPVEFVRPVCRAGEDTNKYDLGKGAKKVEGAVEWAGLDQGYFVSAIFPAQPSGTCAFADGPSKGAGVTVVRLPVEGGKARLALTLYAGPKELDTLRSYGRKFDTALDYGWAARPFAFFARGLLYILRWFEARVGNWGIAIILLTVLVKVVLLPLTITQMRSMAEMRKLQPEVEKLKAKLGDDREKLQVATMELYRQHKVNPFSGCLPLLLQMPIWFALYATLQTSVELYAEPFLWIPDLTRPEPATFGFLRFLPLAMGSSQFLMQRISPQPTDDAQAKMMLYFMPALFTFMMWSVPGGLTLYIFVNNILSIGQQIYMMRKMPAMQPVKPAKG